MAARQVWRSALGAGVMAGGMVAWPLPAQAPSFAALAKLERGQWQLSETGGGRRAVCLADPTILLQLRNRGVACSRFVIDNTAEAATVHYTCPGSGHGRTTVTVETPRLARIQSQGLEGGAPFDIDVEARRIGPCG